MEPGELESVALQPTSPDDRSYDRERTLRKRAAALCTAKSFSFNPKRLKVIPEQPLIYWWDEQILENIYCVSGTIRDLFKVRQGLITGDNNRFVRMSHELDQQWTLRLAQAGVRDWQPYIQGAEGREWFEPLLSFVRWSSAGLEIQNLEKNGKLGEPQGPKTLAGWHFKRGVSLRSDRKSVFQRGIHRFKSIFSDVGASVFSDHPLSVCCSLNTTFSRGILNDLNPTIHFTIGDVNRLPALQFDQGEEVFLVLNKSFTEHECHREPSVEFRHPGPSSWRVSQAWAQSAVRCVPERCASSCIRAEARSGEFH